MDTGDCVRGLGAGATTAFSAEAQLQALHAKAQVEDEFTFTRAFETLRQAAAYRADPAFMEKLRVWLRGKRAELDGLLDQIGV